MHDIIARLRGSAAVRGIQVLDMVDEPTVKYLKCYAELVDHSRLYITESLSLHYLYNLPDTGISSVSTLKWQMRGQISSFWKHFATNRLI